MEKLGVALGNKQIGIADLICSATVACGLEYLDSSLLTARNLLLPAPSSYISKIAKEDPMFPEVCGNTALSIILCRGGLKYIQKSELDPALELLLNTVKDRQLRQHLQLTAASFGIINNELNYLPVSWLQQENVLNSLLPSAATYGLLSRYPKEVILPNLLRKTGVDQKTIFARAVAVPGQLDFLLGEDLPIDCKDVDNGWWERHMAVTVAKKNLTDVAPPTDLSIF